MDGLLSDHPLAELIHEISGARLSGALRLARERVKAVVYFRDGEVVAALMNLRATRLAEVLRRSGAADEARLADVLRDGMTDEQVATAAVRAGLVSEGGMKKLQARQSAEVLREMLRWQEGEWAFEPNVRPAGNYRALTNTAQFLVEYARNLPPEAVARRLAHDDETLSPSEGAAELMESGVQLLPNEAFVMTRVFGATGLGEVIALSGLHADEARRAVYALVLGGVIERERWPHALSPEFVKQAKSRAEAAAAAESAQDAAGQKKSDAEEAPPPSVTSEAEADPARAVEELFARAAGANHYEVLGVARSVPAADIKRAYYALARRLHPDRFRRDADEALQQRIDAAFAKIAQAYETLKDSSSRSTYDLKLARQTPAARTPTPPAPDPKPERAAAQETRPAGGDAPAGGQGSAALDRAEKSFREGLAALGRGDYARARALFAEAALGFPMQARYRAYFGRALARDKASRRQAESELQAAVGLEPGNASYRVMLAELYAEVGMRRKAEGELERALALDPGDAGARRMLEELRRAG